MWPQETRKKRSIVQCRHIYIRLFRFVRVHAFDRQTDRRTDRQMSIVWCEKHEVRCAQKFSFYFLKIIYVILDCYLHVLVYVHTLNDQSWANANFQSPFQGNKVLRPWWFASQNYTVFTRAYRYCVHVSHTCTQYRYARVNLNSV